jgi:hypothetical protein
MVDAQLREAYLLRRSQRDAAQTDLMGRLADVQRLERQLSSGGGASARPDLALLLEHARTAASSAASELENLNLELDNLRTQALKGNELLLLAADCPALLFPVRLEVRAGRHAGWDWLFDDAGQATHMIVRIFPDQCHLDTHDPLLTDTEAAWAREYADKVAASSQDLDDILPIWVELVGRTGPQRGRWLAEIGDGGTDRSPGPFSRGATARLLPDRWHVRVGFHDGTESTAASTLVREPLPAGPDPHSEESLSWARDLKQAFQAGMAVSVPLNGHQPDAVRRIVCVGIRAALTPEASRADLEALLTAHRCTDGLSLLPAGSPTTSTVRGRAPHRDFPPPSLYDVWRERRTSLAPESTGVRLAAALGVDAGALLRVDGTDGTDLHIEDLLRRLLAHALRPAYTDLLCPPLQESTMTATTEHALSWISALGPLPVVRVGAQPYGVLPVIRVLHAAEGAPMLSDPVVVAIERFRQELWTPAAERSPRIRPGLKQPEKTLVALLLRDGAPSAFRARLLVGDRLSQELLGQGPPWQNRWVLARDRLAALLATDPTAARALGLALAPAAAKVTVPLVASDSDKPSDYLPALLNIALRDLPDPQQAGRQPLLYHLARAALLESADVCIRRAADAEGAPQEWFPQWSGSLSNDANEDTWTVWDRLSLGVEGQFAAEWLDANLTHPWATEYADTRRLVSEIGTRAAPSTRIQPQVSLEPILRATLGLGHRLDAWYTSLAWRRLQQLREHRPSGLILGGYGIIDGFLPGKLSAPDGGYIHAPGPSHAATAAVLRSAHLARSGAATGTAASRIAAVNLSSSRVRSTLRLLEGVRAGQSVNELLGQRLEASLMEDERQVLIAPMRARFPLVANRVTPTRPGEPAGSVASPSVIDGHAALHAAGFPENLTVDTGFLPGYRTLTAAEADSLATACEGVADDLDALGDTLLAEGVFQLAQGNMARAAATMDFLAGAPVGVPEPEVVRTPRTAQSRQVRLVAVLPSEVESIAWPETPRGAADPRLAAWAASIIPKPDLIHIAASHSPVSGAATVVETTLATLNAHALTMSRPDLTVGPLDLAFQSRAGVGIEDAPGPIDSRLIALFAFRFEVSPAELTILPGQTQTDTFTIRDAVEAAGHFAEMVLAARPLEPSDLQAPSEPLAPFAAEQNELRARAVTARTGLEELAARLRGWATGSHDVDALIPLLAEADQYGIPGAMPLNWDDGPAAWTARAAAVEREAARRVSGIPAAPSFEEAAGAIRILFGGIHMALSILLAVDQAWIPGVQSQIGAVASGASTELARWARVRPPAGRLEMLDVVTRAVGGAAAAVHKFGLPASVPGDGTTTIIAYQPPLPKTWGGTSICGLALDSWVDAIPASTEITSIAFQADTPTSEPPNLWLLAVPERNHDIWTTAELFAYIDEALDLARLRAVAPTDLGVDNMLPPWLAYAEPRTAGPPWGTMDPNTLTKPPT